MSVEVQISGTHELYGIDKHHIAALCEQRFRDRAGWLHVHIKPVKDAHKGGAHVAIMANSKINNRQYSAEVDGFGLEPTMRTLLDKLENQMVKH